MSLATPNDKTVSRHLQLARRTAEQAIEPVDDGGDGASQRARQRELPERWKAKPPAAEDASDDVVEPEGDSPSYEMAVRLLCPFCGSGECTPATPVCPQALDFNQALMVPEAAEIDGFSAALRSAHHPDSALSDDAQSALEGSSRPPRRMFDAAQLLVALLASALIAAVVSVATQRELADRSADEVHHGAHVVARELLTALQTSPAAKPVEQEAPPATAASSPPAPPAAAEPAVVKPAPAPAPVAAVPAPPAAPPVPAAPVVVASAPSERASTSPSPVAAPAPPALEPFVPSVAVARPATRSASLPPTPEPGKWKSLRRGMSRAAVRALLGYPKWIDHSRNIDFWLYEEDSIFGKGWVAFYDVDGPVSTWREP